MDCQLEVVVFKSNKNKNDNNNNKNTHHHDHHSPHHHHPPPLSVAVQEELQFHYFKLHDANNDNLLDGWELMFALNHDDDRPDAAK